MTEPLQTASVQIVTDFTGFARELEAGVRRAFLALQPQLSKASARIGAAFEGAARDAAGSLDQVARAAGHAGDEVGDDLRRGGRRAERALREVGDQADRSLGRVRREAGRAESAVGAVGRGLGLLGPALIGAGAAAAAGLGAVATFGLKAAAAQEQSLIALESLLGGADQAKKTFSELQQFAAKTPFELPQLLDVTKRFLAFGKTVGLGRDQLVGFLTTVGNIASVTSSGAEGMARVTLALGQIASRGRLSLEEINQLSEALPGFSGLAAIAAAKGISTGEAMKLISQGAITGKEGVDALIKGMQTFPGAADAMAKQSQTLLGLFSTFKDDVSAALIGGFDPVIPELKQTLADITPIIKDAAADIAPVVGGLLASLGPLLAQLVQAITPILGPLISGLQSGLGKLGPALGPLGEALGKVVKALEPLLPITGELAGKLALALVPVLEEFARILEEGDTVPNLIELTRALIQALPALTQLAILILRVAEAADRFSLLNVLRQLSGFGDRIQQSSDNLRTVLDSIGGFFQGLIDRAGNMVESVVGFFAALPGRVGRGLAALPGILAGAAATAMSRMAFAVGFGIGRVIRFFIDLPGNVSRLVASLWQSVTRLFQAGVNKVVAFFASLPGRLSSSSTRTQNLLRDMVNRAVRFVAELPGRVAGFIAQLPGRIATAGRGLFSAGYELARNIVNGLISGFRNLVSNAFDALRRSIASGLAGVRAGLGIGSPSKVFAEQVGLPIGQGIALGIREGAAELSNALTAVTTPRPAAAPPAGVRVTPSAAVAAERRIVLELRGDGSAEVALLLQMIRRAVARAGGEVQEVLGTKRR